jgi:hypothetical protein
MCQKAMPDGLLLAFKLVLAHDVTAGVDPRGNGEDSVGEIDRGEVARAPQKAVGMTVSIHVPSDNLAARINIERNGGGRRREINRGKGQESALRDRRLTEAQADQ